MTMTAQTTSQAPRVLIVGGGQAGMHVAARLRRRLRPGEATVTVVDPHSYLTYQPLLAEAAAGSLEPRHVVVPLRQVLPGVEVITRPVVSIDHSRRTAYLASDAREPQPLEYDLLVLAAGSVTRVLPVPGLAERGIGFKTVVEAIHLRNHVLAQLDAAVSATSAAGRDAALTFVFVGGGYAGVEALAELQDMAHDACRRYPGIDRACLRWVLVEAAGRILPEVGDRMGCYTVELLRRRGIDVRLNTRLTSAVHGQVVLDDGSEFDAGTLVWTAGVAPHPLLKQTDLPLDERGRVVTTEYLSVVDIPDVWALGDCAAVPDGHRWAVPAQRAARGAAGAGNGRQHRRHAARPVTEARIGTARPGRSPASGCTRASRRSTACGCGLSRLAGAPHLPSAGAALLEPAAARRGRLDACPVVPPRDRVPGCPGTRPGRVHRRRLHWRCLHR